MKLKPEIANGKGQDVRHFYVRIGYRKRLVIMCKFIIKKIGHQKRLIFVCKFIMIVSTMVREWLLQVNLFSVNQQWKGNYCCANSCFMQTVVLGSTVKREC